MSRMNQILITVLFIIFVTGSTFGDWKEDAKAIDISGGEDHTLVLTANRLVWGCGHNGWWQLGIGYYGDQKTLVPGAIIPRGGILVDCGWMIW